MIKTIEITERDAIDIVEELSLIRRVNFMAMIFNTICENDLKKLEPRQIEIILKYFKDAIICLEMRNP